MDLRFDEKHCYRYDEAAHITLNSELYRAMDMTLSRDVALKKVIIAGNNYKEKQENYNRALQEVKTMVQISGMTAKIPNIYTYFYDEKQSALYIVMQWINGQTLGEKMIKRVPDTVFLKWMQELVLILDVMGKKRFQHKDIKPDNIMFNSENDLYLIDFNISVSVPNQVEGTPLYKPPEMDFGSITADRSKADMFSIGVMLYQQITGYIPQRMVDYDCFDPAGGKWDFFKQPVEIKPDINTELNDIVIRLMKYNPNDRFKSYADLNNKLKQIERIIRNERKSGQRNR